ncbi:PilN family type IVB pilus formation outer membrane protein [Escherichia coli]
MKKFFCAVTALSVVLSGCSSFERISATEKKASDEITRAERIAGELRKQRAVVRETNQQWINTTPLPEKTVTRAIPDCPVVINTREAITLHQIAQRISETCHIPVQIMSDVWTLLGTGENRTQRISGDIPPPDTSGMQPLSTVGLSSAAPSTASLPELNVQGLPALLDTVSSRFGITWRYVKGKIEFHWLDTRTFPVTYMDSQVAYNARVVSGTMSSTGSSGGSSGSSLSGDASNTQTTAVDMKSTLYEDTKNAVNSMLTPGIGRMVLSTGFLTVTDTPQVLDTVKNFMEERNREMRRQVVLNIEILSIKKTSKEQAGIDWNAVFSDGDLGIDLTSAFTNAADEVVTSGVSIIDGKLTGSKAFLKALSSQGKVSVVTQNSAVTKNLTPVPMQVANQQGYIESVTTDTTANVGSSTSLNAATITTGFNMTLLPFIQPGSHRLQLLFSMSLSDKPVFEVFESGGSRAQTPSVELKTINQTIDLKSDQTVILSGFQQFSRKSLRQGVGTPSFFGLGGGVDSADDDTILVVLITPHVI